MNKPERLSDILESKRPDTITQRMELVRACHMTGYRFFSSGGNVYEVTNQPDDFRNIGLLADLFPRDSMESRLSMDAPGHADLLGNAVNIPEIMVIDNFYATPDRVRQIALASDLEPHPERHKGLRSSDFPIREPVVSALAEITGPMKSSFSAWQLNVAGDQRVFHSDHDRWAGLVYLSPDAPPSTGTSFYRSRRARRVRKNVDLDDLVDHDLVPTVIEAEALVYGGNAILDRTKWTEVDRVGNVYNRLVVWDARLIHSISEPFGYDNESGRLVQLFFWN